MVAGRISIASVVVTSVISASVAVSYVSATASFSAPVPTTSITSQDITASYFIVPTIVLPEESVLTDPIGVETDLQKDFEAFKTEGPAITDDGGVFNTQIVKADSVTMIESRVKVFTDFIDFDPTDDDVDATPVTINDTQAFDASKSISGLDETTVSESTAKSPNKPGITDSVATLEAINQLRPHKNVTDTATISEVIDRFDVATELTDTISVTEEIANAFTQVSTDEVTAVQSNVKAFTSNIDFDLSDADVDPDPVTASDEINIFAATKGLTDTTSPTETTAKNFTHGGFSDTASPVESTAFNVTVPGIGDSLTAVEGIKNNPTLGKSDTISPSDTITSFNVTSVLSDSLSTPTDAINSFAINLAKSDTVTITEVVARNYTLVEDFDRTDADADPDPVTITESIAFEQAAVFSDTLSPTESITQFAITTVYSDTASVTENIVTNLLLGESDFLYPNNAYAIDSDTNSSSIRGYHRGLGESGAAFVQDVYRFDSDKRDESVGIIGSSGLINQPRINGQSITYAETSSAGLLVNFIYTDTDDTELGGHFLNETPLCAGRHT